MLQANRYSSMPVSGKFENVKLFLAKMWKHISGIPKVVEEEKKEKS